MNFLVAIVGITLMSYGHPVAAICFLFLFWSWGK